MYSEKKSLLEHKPSYTKQHTQIEYRAKERERDSKRERERESQNERTKAKQQEQPDEKKPNKIEGKQLHSL